MNRARKKLPFSEEKWLFSEAGDLTPCDFFLWGYLKASVYQEKPTTLEEIQTAGSSGDRACDHLPGYVNLNSGWSELSPKEGGILKIESLFLNSLHSIVLQFHH